MDRYDVINNQGNASCIDEDNDSYDKPYKTKLYYDRGNGAEPFPNLGIYMYDGLGSKASEIKITDMYDQESKILSIPKVTGKIKIYHAMQS